MLAFEAKWPPFSAKGRFKLYATMTPAGEAGMKRHHLTGLVVAALAGALASGSAFAGAGKDWNLVGGDPTSQRYSTLSQIDTRSVKNLQGAWMSEKFDEGASSRSTPVVHDGLMFLTAGAQLYALDARTGKRVWSWRPDSRKALDLIAVLKSGFGQPNYQGVAVAEGKVFAGLMDGHVVALDEKTGAVLWTRQVGEESPQRGQAVSAAPTYADGVVFAGLSNGDFGLRGRVVALDAKTGRELWHFFSIPAPGEPGSETWPRNSEIWKLGGGGIWLTGVVDPELGAVYFTTGNTVPQYGGELRPGDNLYTSSVLALDIKTGKLRWHYQVIHHDIWDADIATAPILYDAVKDGKTRKAIAALRSDGYLFLLDRETGKPILPVKEQAVPQSSFSKTARTQPFPVGADSILPECSYWKDKVPAGFVLDCTYTPASLPPPSRDIPNILAPGFSVWVTPMSFSPDSGYFYGQGTASLAWRRRTADPFYLGPGNGYIPDLKSFGVLAAIDSRTDKIAWKKEMPVAVLGKGGSLTTAGGLLIRLGGDGNFTAYDAKTGDLLWQFQTGFSGGSGSPAVYELDGQEYIAISAGPVVWAFSLKGALQPVASGTPGSNDQIFASATLGSVGPTQEIDHIETALLMRNSGDLGNRYFVDEYSFSPARARVKVGTRVTWSNNGLDNHTIVARDGSWTTGAIQPGGEGYVTFAKPGTYTYICKEHPWSYGQLVVVEDAPLIGLYSQDQAARGKDEYSRNCGGCHMESLTGNGQATALVGAPFMAHWAGRPIADLFDRVRTTMPQKKPNSLSREAYLDIVTYLMQANDFPAGRDRLAPTPEAMKAALKK